MNSVAGTSFGALLRRYRRGAALSQESLAERAGLSTDAIRALERGRRTPRAETVGLLTDALGLTAGDRAIFAAAATDSPAPPTATLPIAMPSALPAPPTALLGREREEASVVNLLRRERVRLVTLTGPGGVGKTRLALQVAATLRPEYADGAVFVDLSTVSDPALVPSVIGRATGMRERGSHALDDLIAHLAQRRALLVLDNFEHVLDAAVTVAAVVAQCPDIAVLVTSRTALGLRAEQQFPVPPLTTPPEPSTNAEEMAGYAAVRLFVARAQAADPSFTLTEENAAAIAAICARLDGLPLAIELAAAQSGIFAPAALLARLPDMTMRMGGLRDLPDRQRTLQAAINWSYDLLTAAEQAVFARAAVFVGGFTLDAAEAICTTDGQTALDIATAVATLIGANLLRVVGAAGEVRIGMLETIRDFARVRLAALRDVEALRSAHAAHYAAVSAAAAAHFRSADEAEWMEQLAREHDNLRAALAWYHAVDPAAGLQLAAHLWPFWWARGHVAEGRSWLERFLDRPETAAVQMPGRLGAGFLAMQQGDWDAARAHFTAGLELSRARGDDAMTAWLLCELGMLEIHSSAYPAARAVLEEAIALSGAAGDAAGREESLLNLARLARIQGDFAAAAAALDAALASAEARRSDWSLAAIRAVRGDTARDRGDHAAAEAEYDAGLRVARAVGHTTYIAWTLAGLGQIALLRGEAVLAIGLLEECLALQRALGNAHSVGFVLHTLGLAWLHEGDLGHASRCLHEALVVRERLGGVNGVADTVEGLALVMIADEQAERGVSLLAAVAATRAAIGTASPPIEQSAVTAATHRARAALGAEIFAAAWAAGEGLSLDAAARGARAGTGRWRVPARGEAARLS